MKSTHNFLMAICLLFSTASFSQRLSLGGKIAFNNTAVYNKNIFEQVDYVKTHSNSLGAQLNIMFSKKWGITSDVLLAAQNQKYTWVDQSNTFNGESKFTYLDIPFLVKRKNKIGLYFEGGPMASFLLSANETVFNSDGSLNYTNKDFKNDFNSFGISAVAGLGWDIKISRKLMLSLEGRMGYMFTDVTKQYPDDELLQLFTTGQISLNTLYSHIDPDGNINYEKSTRIFTGVNVGLHWVIVPFGLK